MTVQLTIIGLGQIGASVGLALADHRDKILRIGHDPEPTVAKKAYQLGAVDKITYNLPNSVEDADIILLDIPVNQIYDTLKIIAPCLKENAVIMETSHAKRVITEWMKEILPKNRHYVGLLPALNPNYISEIDRSVNAAQKDLFNKGSMAIVAPAGTEGAAIKLAADLSSLLGASAFFMDLAELDGIMSGLQILPQLNAAALSNVIMGRPGWNDGRKLAGSVFAEGTAPIGYEEQESALIESVFMNRENVVQVLDEMITSLEELREKITGEEKENLLHWIEQARRGRSKWLQERSKGDWRTTDFEKIRVSQVSLWKRLFGDIGKLLGMPKGRKEKNNTKN